MAIDPRAGARCRSQPPFGGTEPEREPAPRLLGANPSSPEVLALLRQLVGSMSGLTQTNPGTQPFRFETLEQLDARVAAALRRAAEAEGLAAKSVASYRAVYRLFRRYLEETADDARFLGGDVAVQTRVLEDWIASLRIRGANHTTVNTYFRCLHAALSCVAREQGFVDPTRFVPPRRPRLSLTLPHDA